MNERILVCIEPLDFFLEEINKLDYAIIVVTKNYNLSSVFKNLFFLNIDIKKNYNEVKDYLGNINKEFHAFSHREEFVIEAESLNNEFKWNKDSIINIENLRNKKKMKDIWNLNDIPVAKEIEILENQEISQLSFPCIIKPIAGFASRGVKLVKNWDELHTAKKFINIQDIAFNVSKNLKGYIIEEYFFGEEYAVDTFWYNKKPLYSILTKKHGTAPPHFRDALYYTPSNYYTKENNDIIEKTHAAVLALGINTGVTHTEIKINGNKYCLIENAFRPGANAYFYKLFSEVLEINFFKFYLSLLNGNRLEIENLLDNLSKKSICNMFYYFAMPHRPCKIESISGLEKVKENFIVHVDKEVRAGEYFVSIYGKYDDLNYLLKKVKNNYNIIINERL